MRAPTALSTVLLVAFSAACAKDKEPAPAPAPAVQANPAPAAPSDQEPSGGGEARRDRATIEASEEGGGGAALFKVLRSLATRDPEAKGPAKRVLAHVIDRDKGVRVDGEWLSGGALDGAGAKLLAPFARAADVDCAGHVCTLYHPTGQDAVALIPGAEESWQLVGVRSVAGQDQPGEGGSTAKAWLAAIAERYPTFRAPAE